MLKAIIITWLLAALAGCSLSSPRVDDLRFVSVSTVNLLDHTEIDWLRSGSNVLSRPSVELLQIKFETHNNLEGIARSQELHITNSIFFCRDGVDKYDGGIGRVSAGVFSSKYLVDAYLERRIGKNDLQTPNSKGMFSYYVYMDIVSDAKREEFNLKSQLIPAYDLRRSTDDLCVRVQGGNMILESFLSNIFALPASAIVSATHNARIFFDPKHPSKQIDDIP